MRAEGKLYHVFIHNYTGLWLASILFEFLLFSYPGVELGGSGTHSIRFRPSLIFSTQHADILFEITEKVASEIASQK